MAKDFTKEELIEMLKERMEVQKELIHCLESQKESCCDSEWYDEKATESLLAKAKGAWTELYMFLDRIGVEV